MEGGGGGGEMERDEQNVLVKPKLSERYMGSLYHSFSFNVEKLSYKKEKEGRGGMGRGLGRGKGRAMGRGEGRRGYETCIRKKNGK